MKENEFLKERERLNDVVFKYAGKEIKRFFSLDGQFYREGNLDEKTKEMLGLCASMVLRCDDCIKYHITRSKELGATNAELEEVMGISTIVGGSIVIPHMRRAFDFIDKNFLPDEYFILIKEVKKIIKKELSKDEKLLEICKLLEEKIEYFDWVGFYFVDPDKDRELVLGPYIGAPTDHIRIPFGEGICGQAAEREISFVVQDVSMESNYLSCGDSVKSEILSPIFKNGNIIGEIDIDSHSVSPFNENDRVLLETIAEIVEEIL